MWQVKIKIQGLSYYSDEVKLCVGGIFVSLLMPLGQCHHMVKMPEGDKRFSLGR